MRSADSLHGARWASRGKNPISIAMPEEKLSKKQQKALLFRQLKELREKLKEEKLKEPKEPKEPKKPKADKDKTSKPKSKPTVEANDPSQTDTTSTTKRKAEDLPEDDDAVPKKRKTRRGKKGKGVNGGSGPRFILFVGNLPFDIKETELQEHFKKSKPDRIRARREKGIAFVEFDSDDANARKRMEKALRMHHTELRKRKINVELTVGGGGKSETRQKKLKAKNEKLEEQRKKKTDGKDKKEGDSEAAPGGMHPARAALILQGKK